MKVALCIYGYYNNRRNKTAGDNGYRYIKDTILSKVDNIDIFIHTWEHELKEKIEDLYNPKDAIYEKQVDFNHIAIKCGVDEGRINKGFDRKNSNYRNCTVHASLSFFYSRMISVELKEKYETDNDFKYDCVVVARFDLGHTSSWHRGYNVSLMPFDPTLDMNFIYSAMWKQLNAGYADQWFFSSSKNIDLLGVMYEKTLTEYFQNDSEYQMAIMNGWFDSDAVNEMSNEIFNENKATLLYKYPRWQMINNHILHKWHMKKMGMYNKSKFI